MSERSRGFSFLTAAIILLASSFVAGKTIAEIFPTSVALAGRLAVASVVLVPLWLVRERQRPRLIGRCCALLCLQALIGVIGFNLLLFQAYAYAGVGSVGIVFGALPVAVAAMAVVFLGERPGRSLILACLLAALGAAQLGHARSAALWTADTAMLGLALSVAAMLCSAGFTTLGKALTRVGSPLAIAPLVSLTGLVLIAPLAVLDAREMSLDAATGNDWLVLAWWMLASGPGYIWLWYAGLARVEAHAAGLVTVALPLTTLALSSVVLGEVVTGQHLVGIGLTIMAVMIVSGAQPRARAVLAMTKSRPPRKDAGL